MHWKRNGVRLTSGLHSYGRRLTIINPTSADTGMYVCEAALRGSAFEPARAKAFLSIIGNAQLAVAPAASPRRSPYPQLQAGKMAAVQPRLSICACEPPFGHMWKPEAYTSRLSSAVFQLSFLRRGLSLGETSLATGLDRLVSSQDPPVSTPGTEIRDGPLLHLAFVMLRMKLFPRPPPTFIFNYIDRSIDP